MLFQIKSWINGSILFECDAVSLKIAISKKAYLLEAYLRGAYLLEAYLRGAYLLEAYLRGEKLDKIPLMISGLNWDILITKQHIQIGCQFHTAVQWFKFTDKQIAEMNSEALVWWKINKGIIKKLWQNHCK